MRTPFRREDPSNKAIVTSEAPGEALDRQLAQGILDGDRESLARLLDRHLGAVYGYVSRRLGPGHDELAWEVTSAAFEEALRGMKRYASGSPTRAMRLWLLNLANKHLSRRSRHIIRTAAPAPESSRLLRLRRAMEALSPRKQAVFSLALIEELSPGELAGAMGTGLPRAMRLLRSALKDAGQAITSATPASQEANRG